LLVKKLSAPLLDLNIRGWGFYSYDRETVGATPVHRFSNVDLGAYFYTSSVFEKDDVINNGYGFKYQGVAFYAYDYNKEGSSPVYRFANRDLGIYFFTTSIIERDYLMNNDPGFEYQGVGFYAYNYDKIGTAPVYRFANRDKGFYFYTSSIIEKEQLQIGNLGPEIPVGLWNYGSKTALRDNPFKITANKTYNIKNKDGEIVGQVDGSIFTRVTYDSDSYLKAYGSIADTRSKNVFYFDAVDGNNLDLIFDVNRPDSSYDQYRGKIKIQYTDSSNLWVINTLPMEHYVWGAGEFTGTGPAEHSKVMATIFRTYGYQYITWTSTIYVPYGFRIRSDVNSQIYRGYDWEIRYPNVKKAAQDTRGIVATYKGGVALTPYSSWSDGKSRSFEERWGSKSYPWCQSVSDPYGKHPTMTTKQLEDAGNHMVGLIANGSLTLARDHGWSWQRILNYYYTGINLGTVY
jgi:hypothetical protein